MTADLEGAAVPDGIRPPVLGPVTTGDVILTPTEGGDTIAGTLQGAMDAFNAWSTAREAHTYATGTTLGDPLPDPGPSPDVDSTVLGSVD